MKADQEKGAAMSFNTFTVFTTFFKCFWGNETEIVMQLKKQEQKEAKRVKAKEKKDQSLIGKDKKVEGARQYKEKQARQMYTHTEAFTVFPRKIYPFEAKPFVAKSCEPQPWVTKSIEVA